MATKTIKLTSTTSVAITYSVTSTATETTVKITNIAWKSTRSGGWSKKQWWCLEAEPYDAHTHTYYSKKSTTGTCAAGAASATKAVSWSWSFTRTHEKQDGWSIDLDAEIGSTTSHDDFFEAGYFDFTVPAKSSYAVTYNNNGGTGTHASQTKWYGETLTLTTGTHPTRTGYVFKGWNTKADGSGTAYSASNVSYTANAALTLYAIWNSVITFNANGGNLGSVPSSATVQAGSSYTMPTARPTRADFAFLGWATSASATAKDDRYDPGDTFKPAGSFTLYAVWKRTYRAPALSITTCYRTDASGVPADEGTYVALEAAYSIFDTAAAGQAANSPSWLLSCNGHTATAPASGGTALSGSVTFLLAATLDTESAYTVTLKLTDVGGSSRAVTMSYRLGPAYYPIDVLGDGLLYRPTADTAVDASKTYYTRSGSGTESDPYEYAAVQYPVTSELSSYYEASGPKPGKGVAIGRPATHEGFDVGIPQFSYGRRDYPLFVYSTAPDESDLPTTPCFVLATDDYGLWYYDGN